MCDPVTIGAALIIGGGIASGVGAYQEQEASNRAADYNAEVLSQNIAQVDIQKEQTQVLGASRSAEARQAGQRTTSAQTAATASAGVSVGSDVARTARLFSSAQANADAITAQYNAAQKVRSLDVERESLSAQRAMVLSSKRDPLFSGFLGVLGNAPNLVARFGGGG